MRGASILCVLLAALALCGCRGAQSDPDGLGTPGPPVPLKRAVMHDIQGLHGGEAIWITDDLNAVVQVVKEGQKEKRYRAKITAEQWAELERLVGANDFLNLKIKERTGVPDEIHPLVVVVTKEGFARGSGKWATTGIRG